MRVLLTGHLGYIGCVLTPMLAFKGHQVIGLDSDLFRACTFGGKLFDVPAIPKDVRDVEVDDLRGFDAVIHLAGLSNDPLGDLDPQLTYAINHHASVRLADMARSAGVRRFLFSSSCSTYGAAGQDMLDEEGTLNPVTPYGQSKVWVERDVGQLANDNFSPVFLRNATAYGFSPRLRFDLVLNNLVAWAYTTGLVMLKSDGSACRPLVHIEDISRAFIAALEAPAAAVHNQSFNVGQTQENYLVREVAQIVVETVPASRLETAQGAGADRRNYRVNCDKISRVLPAFVPQWTVRKAAHELYQAYQKYGLTLQAFEGPQFQRLAHIRRLLSQGLLDSNLRFQSPPQRARRTRTPINRRRFVPNPRPSRRGDASAEHRPQSPH